MSTGSNADRTLAVVSHVSFWVFPVLLPAALYLAFRQRRPWVAAHAAEAFNFQFSLAVLIGLLIGFATIAGTLGAVAVLAIIGLWLWGMVTAIMHIVAAADDVLKPYSGPVVHLLRRPSLTGPAVA